MPVDGPGPEIGQASFCWHPFPYFWTPPAYLGWAWLSRTCSKGGSWILQKMTVVGGAAAVNPTLWASLKMNSLPQNPGLMWSYIGAVITISDTPKSHICWLPQYPQCGPHSPLVPVRWIGAICSRSSGGGKKDSHLQEPVSIATGRSTTEWKSFPSS